MPIINELPQANTDIITSQSSTQKTATTTETTLTSVTVPSTGKYLLLAQVTFSGIGSQNKDIFFRIRNETNSDEELTNAYWYAGYQSQTGGAGSMTIYTVADLSISDVIKSTLTVSRNSVFTSGVYSLTAIRLE